ncbi:lysine--tRNA ligase [Patescibacteria group bacterium]
MAQIQNLKKVRLKKLEAIEKAGFLPFPGSTKRTHKISDALTSFPSLSRSKKQIVLTGRMVSKREHGKSTFLHIEDGSGRIQLYFKQDKLGEKGYRFFLDNFDVGDVVEVTGVLFKTKKGEKTLEARDFKMLAKSLLPLPEKWHGLKDTEERFRKRYLDFIFNPEVKKKFKLRSKIVTELRKFLEDNGFLEVETPILQPIYGGAKATPFKTHHKTLNIPLYLRISPELYLKRLIIGGFEKVYEIGKCFRNEGMDKSHNPDFTMLEFYWAYADYKDMMKFTEKMFSYLLNSICKSQKITYEGREINFKTPWKRIEFSELLRKYADVNLDEIHIEALRKKAKKWGIESKGDKAELADEIYKKVCRSKISHPTFVIHHPLGAFPLAKQLEKNPKKTANFQLVVANCELINAFSELNNPLEQEKRWKEQETLYKKGLGEAQRMDKDYLEALEHGMPPASGFGMGVDRLVALLSNSHSLREVILFPTMKPKK